MNVIRDPEQVEISFLHCLGQPAGARVLEIGCGNGRLTWQYLDLAASVHGVDLNAADLSEAAQTCPAPLVNKVQFTLAEAETLPFSNKTFDLAIMAWSL